MEKTTETKLDFMVRPAFLGDAVEILDLQVQHSFLYENDENLEREGKLENLFDLKKMKKFIQQGCVFVATRSTGHPSDEDIIGYIATKYHKALNDDSNHYFYKQTTDASPALLLQVCVKKNFRRQGVGKTLLKQAIDKGLKMGDRKFVTYAMDLNFAASAFLKGFDRRLVREHPINPSKKLVMYSKEFK